MSEFSDWMESMTLLELIEAYGRECGYGGMGYINEDEFEVLEEIKKRLAALEEKTDA